MAARGLNRVRHIRGRQFFSRSAWDVLTIAKQITEGSGAASLATAFKLRDELRGKKVVGILSGGNLPLERFAQLIV